MKCVKILRQNEPDLRISILRLRGHNVNGSGSYKFLSRDQTGNTISHREIGGLSFRCQDTPQCSNRSMPHLRVDAFNLNHLYNRHCCSNQLISSPRRLHGGACSVGCTSLRKDHMRHTIACYDQTARIFERIMELIVDRGRRIE